MLTFRYGVMGCGKTTHLLQVAFNYESLGMRVCVIKPAIDTKNGTKLLSRIGIEHDTNFTLEKTDSILTDFIFSSNGHNHYDCVLIDEAQFLTAKQVDEFSLLSSFSDIPVIAYGLRLNAFMTDEGFEGATRLLQVADKIEEIKTICRCGKKATRNCRFLDGNLQTSGDAVLIDDGHSKIEYKALCSECYFKERRK